MNFLTSVDQLESIYGEPGKSSILKVADHLTDEYRRWIAASRFCALSTVGLEGTDCSPRGDEGPVVDVLDDKTLLMADWHGNNRIDSLRNIIADPRVSLMFLIAGSQTVVRLNGEARLTVDAELLKRFEKNRKQPRSVIVIKLAEIYFQCARALMRSDLWGDRKPPQDLPSAGEFLETMTKGTVDRETYDKEWPGRARSSLW